MTAPARVLFVCTANECRSPFAAAIAQRAARGLPIRFESAGLTAWRRGVPDTGLDRAREMGLDLSDHVSRPVNLDELIRYDLILALARNHARELLAEQPAIRPRLFTLKQFARWASEHPRPRRAAIGPWLDVVATDRPATDFLGADVRDDIDDPLRQPIEAWRRVTEEIESAVRAGIAGLFPPISRREERLRAVVSGGLGRCPHGPETGDTVHQGESGSPPPASP